MDNRVSLQHLLTPCRHLLGKKSWNVYNADNIEKVKRDEAIAQAAEEAEEQRIQEVDAERRIRILRGEDIPLPAIENAPTEGSSTKKREHERHGSGRERKRRKKTGEDDTDFEMRVVREDREGNSNVNNQLVLRQDIDVPLVDDKGHIVLFPQAPISKQHEKDAEAAKELAKKKKEYQDSYTVRMSDAAGFKVGLDAPWYSKDGTKDILAVADDTAGKNIWGNDDPKRKEREARRVVSNDPLAMMKAGAQRVRQVKQERAQSLLEQEKVILELADVEAKRMMNKRKYVNDEYDEMNSFRLDEGLPRKTMERIRERSPARRDRDRSRERSSTRNHRDHRDRSREGSTAKRHRDRSPKRSSTKRHHDRSSERSSARHYRDRTQGRDHYPKESTRSSHPGDDDMRRQHKHHYTD